MIEVVVTMLMACAFVLAIMSIMVRVGLNGALSISDNRKAERSILCRDVMELISSREFLKHAAEVNPTSGRKSDVRFGAFAIKNSPLARAASDSASGDAIVGISIENSSAAGALPTDMAVAAFGSEIKIVANHTVIVGNYFDFAENVSGVYIRPVLTKKYTGSEFGTWDSPRMISCDTSRPVARGPDTHISTLERIVKLWEEGKIARVHLVIKYR
jgi:hypothetical protein